MVGRAGAALLLGSKGSAVVVREQVAPHHAGPSQTSVQGGFLIAGPPGKPWTIYFLINLSKDHLSKSCISFFS